MTNQKFMKELSQIWNKSADKTRNPVEAKRVLILKTFSCLKVDKKTYDEILVPARKELLDKIGMF